jgi:hypothetical protein
VTATNLSHVTFRGITFEVDNPKCPHTFPTYNFKAFLPEWRGYSPLTTGRQPSTKPLIPSRLSMRNAASTGKAAQVGMPFKCAYIRPAATAPLPSLRIEVLEWR